MCVTELDLINKIKFTDSNPQVTVVKLTNVNYEVDKHLIKTN